MTEKTEGDQMIVPGNFLLGLSKNVAEAREIAPPPEIVELAESIGHDPLSWYRQCHAASLALVKAGVYGPDARVARGVCRGVGGQHSWIVFPAPGHEGWDSRQEGPLAYSTAAIVADPTLWSYDDSVTGLWTGSNLGRHKPHGYGSIWNYGKPTPVGHGEEPITLTPTEPLSDAAAYFLMMCGPLGRRGWSDLANGPMQGWPSAEIIAAMDDTPALSALIPVDILGIVAERDPEGLYR